MKVGFQIAERFGAECNANFLRCGDPFLHIEVFAGVEERRCLAQSQRFQLFAHGEEVRDIPRAERPDLAKPPKRAPG